MENLLGLTWAGEITLMEFGELIGEAEGDGSWDDLQEACEELEDLKIFKGADVSWRLERDYPEKWSVYFAEALEQHMAWAERPGFQVPARMRPVQRGPAEQLIDSLNLQSRTRQQARVSAANRIGYDLVKRHDELERLFNVRARHLLRSGAFKFIGARKDILADEVPTRWAGSLMFHWFKDRIVLPRTGTAAEQVWERTVVECVGRATAAVPVLPPAAGAVAPPSSAAAPTYPEAITYSADRVPVEFTRWAEEQHRAGKVITESMAKDAMQGPRPNKLEPRTGGLLPAGRGLARKNIRKWLDSLPDSWTADQGKPPSRKQG